MISSSDSNKRILVIDDNTAIHEDFQKILGRPRGVSSKLDEAEASIFGHEDSPSRPVPVFSFEIDSAHQGKEGLGMVEAAVAAGRPYAMAFVDVRMPPGWDGVETIRHLWAVCPDLQIVICTAYSDYSWEEMTGDPQKYDSLIILKKPFDNIEVLQIAHAMTKKWSLTQQARLNAESLDRLVAERTRDLNSTLNRLEAEMAHRSAVQHSLRVSEERFSKAFRSSPFPMAIQCLADDRFEDCNDAFLKMIDRQRHEVIDRTSQDISLWADEQTAVVLQELLQQQHSIAHYECDIRCQSGQIRQTLLAVETFALGKNTYSLLIWQDLSDRVQLEHQLRQSQKMEAVGQLAAGVAHDFNNVLTVIQGHASLRLASTSIDRDTRESLKQISSAAERAAALTRQLLAFSRKQIMQLRGLSLNDSIKSFLGMLHRLIGEHIKVQTRLASALPLIHGDNGSIEQVIMNLVVNARDAMPEGGTLSINTSVVTTSDSDLRHNPDAIRGNFVCLAVQDTGCGMDDATRNHIFEPFFTTKEIGKGTGMGLATVYGIVQQHNGWIEVTSERGRGSIFKVFLPISTETIESAEAPLAIVPKTTKGQETILVVEDEDNLRLLVETILIELGYHTLSACNGVEALKIWSKSQDKIDLLLTDIVMPEAISGLQLAERMLLQKPHLKVIYTSGYSLDLISKGQTLRDGQNFLPKPYHPVKLAQAIRACLDTSSVNGTAPAKPSTKPSAKPPAKVAVAPPAKVPAKKTTRVKLATRVTTKAPAKPAAKAPAKPAAKTPAKAPARVSKSAPTRKPTRGKAKR